MSSQQALREAGKQMVKAIERFPNERIKHIVSFKDSQLQRYKKVAGIQGKDGEEDAAKRASLAEIKDIINRTSGPLGMKKDMMDRINAALPEEQFTEETIMEQLKALNTLTSNKYKNYYAVGDKMYHPYGNPNYYQRIIDELEGKKKETFFTAFRTVVFGK
ncbi:hypothetical protein Kpol_538p17 [Vanderwaltozyma polyspora DSM 70294]|uniref:Uncharacterized protein n=1 Tax=Vanderwaltozyma polyspora (strain ATCC 22028 / DSM 70294 / BCRC 21397 / CBS 2163 / NBRC 10782 / NRRL Y-8283 / UCD 57-17) TaxID=436907 RepID=A7TKD0_VANPO|nr:uncharacterized protein Kpol_538p17 [Vanderwaltozyma polyspora DSM 70294]EDO17257.1 hypothetical protein Kpol_538p17 [Vanderwaltozyma polyspora DSM 70294]